MRRLLALAALAATRRPGGALRAEGAALQGAGAARLGRPIVTGCLLECGVQDQSCVTQCQVCVEEQKCRTLRSDRCGVCLREVRDSTRARATANGVTIDSGGVPLAHEGVQVRLEAARFRSVDEIRLTRRARDAVLVAQRQVEWAAEEWTDQSHELHRAKARLKLAQEQYAISTVEHAKKVKKLESQIARTRLERARLQEELRGAEREARGAREAGAGQGAARARAGGGRTSPEGAARGEAVDKATAREWALRRHLGMQERMEKHLEERLRYEEEHAKWLVRGLEKDVKKAEQDVEGAAGRLRYTRAIARLAEDNLREAKDRYLSAQAMSLRAGKVVDHLEGMIKDRLGPMMPDPPMSYEGGPNQTVPPSADLAYT
ncbi:unnamed protein product [Prorocentrum cordatum]|uniref:Uncharacterized protein n=1 Tax=Prorocentrum cordatum TaxID=2364126 RepID=A0ABN9WD57_9DINO|nr:unnamed protein product [Polarella glacialis]